MFLVANLVTYYAMKERAAQCGMTGESLAKNEIVLQGGLKSLEICKRARHPGRLWQRSSGRAALGPVASEFTIRQEVVSPIEIIRSATTIGAAGPAHAGQGRVHCSRALLPTSSSSTAIR